MIIWVLIGILIQDGMLYSKTLGIYPTEEVCAQVRIYVMDQAEKPKINYETVCIKTNQIQQM